MNISLNWLNDYISINYSPDELAHKLTMIGLEVEEVIHKSVDFSGVVVGKVIEVDDHPNADRLKVCKVDTGETVHTVVCGAPNVANNQLVPLAQIGAVIGKDFKLKTAKIRGIKSDGMICSEKELGLSDDHSGIMVLDPEQYKIGQDLSLKYQSDSDYVFVVNITPNRGDCLSHIGVAREIAAINGKKLNIPETIISKSDISAKDRINIEIQDPEGCPRYCARVVENVEIKESPAWLKKRLESVGIRSINNVVDITNYVLMETGHPLHAFDYDYIEDNKIVVRKAGNNEKFITLDNVERTLEDNDLLICDGKQPVALAGIMGGLNSEIKDTTKNVLLEGAYFDPMTIRRSAKRLGLSTEASYRFERGADPENAVYAVNRAAALIQKFAGGKVADGIIDNNPGKITPWKVNVRTDRVNSVLGSNISEDQIISIFNNLGLSVSGDDPLEVTIPTFRRDLLREIDLIEEVIRLYGFDTIAPSTNTTIPLNDISNKSVAFQEKIRDIFSGIGFNEIINTSMVSQKHISILKDDKNITAVAIKNPLSPETAFMRTSLIPGILDSVRWNHNHSSTSVHLYETGRVFNAIKNSLPKETLKLSGAVTGKRHDKISWKGDLDPVDFYYIKGIVEYLLAKSHIYDYSIDKGEYPLLNSLNTQEIKAAGNVIGYFGSISEDILKSWDVNTEVFAFDLNIDVLFKFAQRRLKYSSIPKFPSIKRDIAFVVENSLTASDIKEAIILKGGKLLKEVELFDLYSGKQIPDGKKSLAFTMTFLSEKRTLREQEIDPIFRGIIHYIEDKFSASLRSI